MAACRPEPVHEGRALLRMHLERGRIQHQRDPGSVPGHLHSHRVEVLQDGPPGPLSRCWGRGEATFSPEDHANAMHRAVMVSETLALPDAWSMPSISTLETPRVTPLGFSTVISYREAW
jgi:hypothetical protein